jgi:hypothetical protein
VGASDTLGALGVAVVGMAAVAVPQDLTLFAHLLELPDPLPDLSDPLPDLPDPLPDLADFADFFPCVAIGR